MAEGAPEQVDGLDEFAKNPQGLYDRWAAEIKLAQKEFDKYQTRCDKIERRYRAEGADNANDYDGDDTPRLNIIWSTVQTQIPAIYQFPPEVEVSRRFRTKDAVARTAALILERYLHVDIDRDEIGDEVLATILDRLLCGRAQMWVEYEPILGKIPQPVMVQIGPSGPMTAGGEPYTGPPPQQGPDGSMMGQQQFDAIVDCRAPAMHIDRSDFLHSPARRWREVRWVARRFYYTRDECAEKFKKGMAQFGWKPEDIPLAQKAVLSTDDEEKTGDLFKRAEVWEVWDDANVYIMILGMATPIEAKPRPLLLKKTKWPCPKPLYGTMTNGKLVPVPDFVQWVDLADEIDELTARIESLTRSVKMVGARPASMDELDKIMLDSTDNELVAVENWAAFKEMGGLEGAISWIPMAQLMEVLSALQAQRKERIDYAYQINGVGDILRGQGDPQATATQERIKATYGSLRLKQMQQDLGEFIERVLEIKAEIICEKAPPEVLIEVSAINEMEAERPNVQPAVAMLKDNRVRDMRIDVDEESMVALDDAEAQRESSEFLQAVVPMVQTTVQAMQAAPAVLDVATAFLGFAVRRFRGGRDLEGVIDQFGDQIRAQAEQARQQASQQPPPKSPEQQRTEGAIQVEQLRHGNKLQEISAQTQAEAGQERAQALSEQAIEQSRMTAKGALMEQQASVEERLALLEHRMDMELERYKADLKAQNDREMAAFRRPPNGSGASPFQ